jgi:hypothetical protein
VSHSTAGFLINVNRKSIDFVGNTESRALKEVIVRCDSIFMGH